MGKKFDVNKIYGYGITALAWACKSNNKKIVTLILKKGAKNSVNVIDKYGKSPIYWACYNNNLKIFKLLIPLCTLKTVNQSNFYGTTPFHLAFTCNNKKIVTLLLQYGANPNKANKKNKIMFYWAFKKKNTDLASLLIPKLTQETINGTDEFGLTPLCVAIRQNNLKIVKLLIQNNAKIRKLHIYASKRKSKIHKYLKSAFFFSLAKDKAQFITQIKNKEELKELKKLESSAREIAPKNPSNQAKLKNRNTNQLFY